MDNTHYQKFKISSYEINPNGNARFTTLANYFQELAYTHAALLGIGYEDLFAKGIAWILSRKHIRIYRYPKWNEELTIETWPRGIDKLFALRDFKIKDAEGEIIAEAASCWLQADVNSHRPLRVPKEFMDVVLRTESVFGETPAKISKPDNMEYKNTRKIRYSDLDIVGHTNNVKYIEMCTDTIPADMILDRGVSDFQITYIGESMLNDEIDLYCSELNAKEIFVSGFNRTRNKESFVAKLNLFSN